MKCENEDCTNKVPDDNIGRICAGNTDHLIEISTHGYNNYRACSCCDECRSNCAYESHKEDTNPF